MRTLFFTSLAFLILLVSCNRQDDSPPSSQTLKYNFENDMEGWIPGMSDFPSDWDPANMEFSWEHAPLPPEVYMTGNAIKISGRNISDDMFMFLKREVSGLKANHTYSLILEIELASQYPEESIGIGGSPGSSVYLKGGGSSMEPQAIDIDGMIQMNIDKGNQAQGGADMLLLGTIGIPGEDFTYTIINRNNEGQPVQVTTDGDGTMWLIVGTDSGFEGTTTLYYNSISIRLQE